MVQQDQSVELASDVVDSAVAQGGAYEVIKKRLLDQGQQLDQQARELNQARLNEFGSSEMSVTARVRVRTENNCIARDIVQVGDHLLFGYNVFIGLKKETKVEDVFALFDICEEQGSFHMQAVDLAGSFLNESSFVNDFDELYRYYKNTKLIELTLKNGKLLAGFQIGERLDDIRVFRWSVSADGQEIKYIDNRGERDIQLPPAYDFEWVETGRDDVVNGRHAHINILDTIFVETVGGDLTIKIENNTEDGQGIYREPVDDETQSLDDAQISYAAIGRFILLKVRPYREDHWRYLVYNTITQLVLRIDEIGQSCVQLPEDHGIIFPGGYCLQTGEYKRFDDQTEGLKFERKIRSPNGEDILFVFYQPELGQVGLFAYNLIEKTLQNPIYGHGYALAEDGQLVLFSAESEPTRVHPMQLWQTPYFSAEFASKAPTSQTFLGRIGNAELVRGVSDLYSVCRMIDNQSVSSKLYETLSQSAKKLFDNHFWIDSDETKKIASLVKEVEKTAELVIDEFEKVESIRQQSNKTMLEAEQQQQELVQSIRPDNWRVAEEYVDALGRLRRQRGRLVTIKEHRYIDLEKIEALDSELQQLESSLSEQTVAFLANPTALEPYQEKIEALNRQVDEAETISELTPLIETIDNTALGLDLLSELMSALKVEDTTVRTQIIDAISQVYSQINQSKANAKHKQKNLGSSEAIAQFGAQFKLFSQSITNALSLASTPESCDEQLSRLLVQLEELESQFSDFEQFLTDIMDKRDEIYESFESHKQQLMDERQRKAQSITDAASRILSSIEKRSLKFTEADELNTYFASDTLVMKSRELAEQLRELGNAVKADDVESRFKSIKEQALRALRDKTDIYEEGGNIIKLGPRHRFSVNTQELDLTIIPRGSELNIHLTGTDYYEQIAHPELLGLRDYWEMSLESETPDVYRGEYLASSIIEAAIAQTEGMSMNALRTALNDDQAINKLVREFASPRYKEGYVKGIHDHDAVLLLKALIPAIDRAGLLKYDPLSRGLAQVFWANIKSTAKDRSSSPRGSDALSFTTWPERAQSALQMQSIFASSQALELLAEEIASSLSAFVGEHPLPVNELDIRRASDYLVEELGAERVEFVGSKYATQLVEELKRSLDSATWRRYQMALNKMLGWPAERWNLTTAWLKALTEEKQLSQLERYIPEAVALINADERLDRRLTETDLELTIEGLLGEHSSINKRALSFSLDAYLQRMERHRFEVVPGYQRYLEVRHEIIAKERNALRLEEFKARPLSSFVRNRLINESYLPLIGDNLAKQMGTVGENKRSDLMGLLMMISPPGYGKTTLMEYVANRLGLIFMKINCPSLGHDVLSLDPQQAPNATARNELEKLNLGLEMGNNVMLYLDDIQHTHPEFLQKFISLCDGTRRVDGVWKGQTKTYDMRGRKFCVVMAGNPYTESGEAFKIPDMLANRADIYNLGDILGGMDEQFSLSYIENSLTSNPVLAPLAVRDMDDVYKLIKLAKGDRVASSDLSHQYSAAEINEITEILQKMLTVQQVILKINKQYIASAAQDDKYRTEPAFKLQGSYRNMNKMTEKITAVMNEQEMLQMIADHYLGEAQLLTTGAEDNLLKLAELRGNMTEEQALRWQQIKKDFLRNKAMGGDDGDVGGRVVAQLSDMVTGIQQLAETASEGGEKQPKHADEIALLTTIVEKIAAALENLSPNIEVINQPVPGMDGVLTVLAETIEHSIYPLVRSMDKKLDIDLRTHDKMQGIAQQLRELKAAQRPRVKSKPKPER
ncbi:ATPase family protein associated with various cellular activities (AAA) [Sinobacterium caligoides]|uniref:ATPase family protein associated with various cellular activities (AAA) n=1 Tax=Sinobacterium caligoides TaxID=933926 RepID=A0A3N2DQA8_9GAMM|nr:DNA repair ATPase [Sinobacterium caligoides]ROS01799.1 ATPase family protein associated with various cellular activities (AAA) [Sinobacterium caligoides]